MYIYLVGERRLDTYALDVRWLDRYSDLTIVLRVILLGTGLIIPHVKMNFIFAMRALPNEVEKTPCNMGSVKHTKAQ